MKFIGYKQLIVWVLVAVLGLGAVVIAPLLALRSESGGLMTDSRLAQLTEARLNAEYTGLVALEGVFTGVYSDTLEPTAMDLGHIDLALALEGSGDAVSGYVSLDRTLVFTQEHTIDGRAVGPLVSGTFDGTTLRLTSEPFSQLVSPGRKLPEDGRILPERRATRQFRLVSTDVQTTGARLVGEYRETIWGLSPEPVSVVGTFTLHQLAPKAQTVYLPLTLKN